MISEAEPHNMDKHGWPPLNIFSIENDNMEEYTQVARTMVTKSELLKINTRNILRQESSDIVIMRNLANYKQMPKERQLEKKLAIEVFTFTQPHVKVIEQESKEEFVTEKSAGGLQKHSIRVHQHAYAKLKKRWTAS